MASEQKGAWRSDDGDPGGSGGDRFAQVMHPIFAGLALDMVDLATFGPIGLRAGVVLGAIAGWVLAPSFGARGTGRWVCAALAGVYCAMPGTSVLPLASAVAAIGRYGAKPAAEDRPPRDNVIDVDFRVPKGDDDAR